VAIDKRVEGTQDLPNAVDRLKLFVRTFRDRRAGLVPGGCQLFNTAIDSDDGNPQLRKKVRQALDYWLKRLQSIAEEGKQRGEIHSSIDSAELAMLIVSSLEGGLMVSRLQRRDDALDFACRHLEKYLETITRESKSKIKAEKS